MSLPSFPCLPFLHSSQFLLLQTSCNTPSSWLRLRRLMAYLNFTPTANIIRSLLKILPGRCGGFSQIPNLFCAPYSICAPRLATIRAHTTSVSLLTRENPMMPMQNLQMDSIHVSGTITPATGWHLLQTFVHLNRLHIHTTTVVGAMPALRAMR